MRWNRQVESGWFPHFALIPRTLIDGSVVWLERVEKRIRYANHVPGSPSFSEYRAMPLSEIKSCQTKRTPE